MAPSRTRTLSTACAPCSRRLGLGFGLGLGLKNPTPHPNPHPNPDTTQEGAAAFFAGVGQRSLYMGPLWAIQFALNGFITNAMLRRREEREE